MRPEYLHVLLNPLPVYGLGLGVFALVLALLFRSRYARVTALSIVFICAISAWPVYHYGEAAYDRTKAVIDDGADRWLEEHVRRGEQLIWVFYVVAGVAAVAIAAEFRIRRAAVSLGVVTAILASANLGAGGYIAYAGGHIRHSEFRSESHRALTAFPDGDDVPRAPIAKADKRQLEPRD